MIIIHKVFFNKVFFIYWTLTSKTKVQRAVRKVLLFLLYLSKFQPWTYWPLWKQTINLGPINIQPNFNVSTNQREGFGEAKVTFQRYFNVDSVHTYPELTLIHVIKDNLASVRSMSLCKHPSFIFVSYEPNPNYYNICSS